MTSMSGLPASRQLVHHPLDVLVDCGDGIGAEVTACLSAALDDGLGSRVRGELGIRT